MPIRCGWQTQGSQRTSKRIAKEEASTTKATHQLSSIWAPEIEDQIKGDMKKAHMKRPLPSNLLYNKQNMFLQCQSKPILQQRTKLLNPPAQGQAKDESLYLH